MKTFEFTEDMVKTICECVTHKIESLIDENTYLTDIPEEYEKNRIRIVSLQTLLNYLES